MFGKSALELWIRFPVQYTWNPLVYSTGDIIDTYVHRTGLVNAQYGLATAVGLLKSVVSFILIAGSYKLAEITVDYRIF